MPDVMEEIVDALNALRSRYDYVITTGGIGPTHDDITADAVAQAFGVELYEHPDIIAMMAARWGGGVSATIAISVCPGRAASGDEPAPVPRT